MAKSPKPSHKTRKPNDETRVEIDRQHKLLALDFDKKSLKGNVKQEDSRHEKEYTGLARKERRECFQIRLQRDEVLEDLKKVRRGYTGHYDDSISPIENIQNALRHQCTSPRTSTRLSVPNVYPMRKARSQEMTVSTARSASGTRPHSSTKPKDRPRSVEYDTRTATSQEKAQSASPNGKKVKSPRPVTSEGRSVSKGETRKPKKAEA